MPKRLTSKEKKQYVVKQTLAVKEINRLENNPDARPISQADLTALLEASRTKTPA